MDIFARTAYRIILGINQEEAHLTNKKLYEMANNSKPISEQVREHQLKFIGHCLRMNKSELTRKYVLYNSNNTVDKGKRVQEKSYIGQISLHINNDKTWQLSENEIAKYAENKIGWESLIAGSKVRKKP